MNHDLRIEKDRVTVTVVTVSGEVLRGDMFVRGATRFRLGPELPVDVMNDGEPFFPLVVGEGETFILAKDQVREIRVASDGEAVEMLGPSRPTAIVLTTVGGPTYVGQIFLEAPVDRPRLLDFLNRYDDRFLPLHTGEGMRLINRRLIERVRPLD